MKKRLPVFAASFLAFAALLTVGTAPGASAATDTCTWTGATDTAFSNGANWSGCDNAGVPENGDSLVINVAASNSPVNDMTSMSFADITFSGAATSQFSVTGNAITVTGDVTNDATGYPVTIGNDLAITGTSTFTSNSTNLVLTGTVSGAGSLVKAGSALLDAGGATLTLTGTVTINEGTARVPYSTSITYSSATIAETATLQYFNPQFTGSYSLAIPVTLGGSLSLWNDASSPDPEARTVNLTGAITLTSNTTSIYAGKNVTVRIQGDLSGDGFSLTKTGPGTVINESSNNTSDTPSGELASAGGIGGDASDEAEAPNTGFNLATTNPIQILVLTLAAGAALFLAGRRLATAKAVLRRR